MLDLFRKSNLNNSETAYMSKRKREPFKSKIICHYCKKTGHIKSKCFKMKREKVNPEDSSLIATAFIVKSQDSWLVESGCSAHMCNARTLFNELKVEASG